jgi:hypothetical protein
LAQISALGEQAFSGYIIRHLALLQARHPDMTVESTHRTPSLT